MGRPSEAHFEIFSTVYRPEDTVPCRIPRIALAIAVESDADIFTDNDLFELIHLLEPVDRRWVEEKKERGQDR